MAVDLAATRRRLKAAEAELRALKEGRHSEHD
jgi:hypothetical protein